MRVLQALLVLPDLGLVLGGRLAQRSLRQLSSFWMAVLQVLMSALTWSRAACTRLSISLMHCAHQDTHTWTLEWFYPNG